MLSTSPRCLSLVGSTQCLQATVVRFLLWASISHQQSQDLGRHNVLTNASSCLLWGTFGVNSGSSLAMSTPGFVPASLLAWTRLSTATSAFQSNVDLRALTVNQNPKCCLWTFVSQSLPWKLCNSSPCFPRFLACSLMLLKVIHPLLVRVLLSRTSVSNGAVGSLSSGNCCSMGLQSLGVQPKLFSQLSCHCRAHLFRRACV